MTLHISNSALERTTPLFDHNAIKDDSTQYPKRPPRIQLFGGVRPFYFITFNAAERRAILAHDSIHTVFVNFCERAHAEFSVSVGRYVIMPDHVHLFVCLPEDGILLRNWVKALKSVLAKELLRMNVGKPHWQEGFFDHVLRSGESYGEKWHYVSNNPQRAGLIGDDEIWPYAGEIIRLSF